MLRPKTRAFYGGGWRAKIHAACDRLCNDGNPGSLRRTFTLDPEEVIPVTWSPLRVYFIITLIVSLLAWTSLAREVRVRLFALRGEDFVTAAKLDGSSERRVIFRHILLSLTSHILAVVTLALPTMIVAEAALSVMGIGMKPPVVSWRVLLQDAQNIRTIATAPWLLAWPAASVVCKVPVFNFLGYGMRDAADPYEL